MEIYGNSPDLYKSDEHGKVMNLNELWWKFQPVDLCVSETDVKFSHPGPQQMGQRQS